MAQQHQQQLRVADIFCGIGSFHISAEALGMRCVYACDNDPHVQKVYQAHFGMLPDGDIQKVVPETVPDHDILCAGFPCQPFSRMGNKRGSNEERGRVMDYAIDILRAKRPRAFILENVRGFLTSNGGEDFKRLEVMIEAAGYSFQQQILKCEDFGIPQTRHRVFMIGFRDGFPTGFQYPKPTGKCPTLSEYLGLDIMKPFSYTVRCFGRKSGVDNAKNWSAYKLKDGTVFEYTLDHVTKIQGFPDDFSWGGVPDSQKWKMLGNTIPTCLSRAILDAVGRHLQSQPEMPPMPLPPAVRPPPARKLIEDRLSKCSQKAKEAKKKRAREASSESSGGSEGEGAEESGSSDSESPSSSSSSESDCKGSSSASSRSPPAKKPHLATVLPVASKPKLATGTPPVPPVIQVQAQAQAVTTTPKFSMQLTVKSGAEFSMVLPAGTDEQIVLLKIVS